MAEGGARSLLMGSIRKRFFKIALSTSGREFAREGSCGSGCVYCKCVCVVFWPPFYHISSHTSVGEFIDSWFKVFL